MKRFNVNFLQKTLSILTQTYRTNRLIKNNVYNIRLYCGKKLDPESEIDHQSTTYKSTESQFTFGKKNAIRNLEEILEVKRFTALDMIERCKGLKLITGNNLSHNYNNLKMEGVSNNMIIKYPEVLLQKNIKEKLALLSSVNIEVEKMIPLLRLNLDDLAILANNFKVECPDTPGGRITILSELLQIPEDEMCEAMIKRSFLRYLDLTRLQNVLNILTEYGITTDEITRDYWVLKYSTRTVTARLNYARVNNVEKLKTWMIRCSHDIFNRYLERRSENKQILGNSSLVEYLSERLECPTEEAKYILIKHPALKTKSMKKINEIFDFFYGQGFKPLHILRNPKILLHSIHTTSKRLKELEKQQLKIDSLYMLTKSQKQFLQYLEGLVKSKKIKTCN